MNDTTENGHLLEICYKPLEHIVPKIFEFSFLVFPNVFIQMVEKISGYVVFLFG